MIEVFRTNVQGSDEANTLKRLLLEHFPSCDIHFDLEDCDKVLRMEGPDLCAVTIISLLDRRGFYCTVLD